MEARPVFGVDPLLIPTRRSSLDTYVFDCHSGGKAVQKLDEASKILAHEDHPPPKREELFRGLAKGSPEGASLLWASFL